MLDAVAVLIRALSFIAVFQAAGGAVFRALLGEQLQLTRAPIRRAVLAWTLVALVLVLAQFALEAARLAGDFSGIGDAAMQAMAWNTAPGTGLRLRVAALLLILAAMGTALPRPAAAGLSAMGVLVLAVAFTTLGHTVDHAPRSALATLLVAHLLCVAFWFGALGPLRQIVRHETAPRAAAVLARFSRLAVWTVPALFAAGLGLLLLLVPSAAVFAQPYGQLLLAKMSGFALLMGLAAWNKLRLTPALAGGDAVAATQLRRSLLLEWLLISAVLLITAVMTGLYSPD